MELKYLYYITKNDNKIHILLIDNDMNIYGYIYLNRLSTDEWEVVSVAALDGYGYKMHDVAMDLVYPSYILPARDGQIKEKLINTYIKYFDRIDVTTESIDSVNYDWFHTKYKLKKKKNIPIENGNITIKYMGIKFFNKLYEFKK